MILVQYPGSTGTDTGSTTVPVNKNVLPGELGTVSCSRYPGTPEVTVWYVCDPPIQNTEV